MRVTRTVLVVAAVLLGGCSRYDVEALCEELDAECNQGVDLADCLEDGEKLEEQVDEAGCDDELDTYLECLEIGPCRWETRCQGDRERLIACAGEFPTL